MLPVNLGLWALFSVKDLPKMVDKLVAGEPKPSDVVAEAYVAAVKKDGTFSVSLEDKVDKLALICRAMWELLRDKYGLSDEVLLNKVKEIDLLDGVLDGKVHLKPKACPKCGRLVSTRRMHCIYCGADVSADTPFEKL
jgi:ribosomal protein S27AE